MMQIRLTLRDELGREVHRFPAGSWEPHGPDGISLGPGGTVMMATDIPHAGRYIFAVEGLTAPPSSNTESTDTTHVHE